MNSSFLESIPLIIDTAANETEIWKEAAPQRGDHIRVNRAGLYNHHGIYVSDAEVIHFTGRGDDSVLDWSKCEVISTSLAEFLRGGVLEVKEYTDDEFCDLYPANHIVEYARACLGDKSYHLIFNNCEHFANVCTLGRFRSRQVERILCGKLPFEEKRVMGLWDSIKSIFGLDKSSSGGSRSTTSTTYNTTYEPDKVKVAQIEADTKIRLANMEAERVELMRNARLEILEYETRSQLAIEQAKAQGMAAMAQTIIAMQEKLNAIAEKRLMIIEKGSLQVVKEIEHFYDEIGKKIQEDDDKYNTEKLPELLAILGKYEEGSPAHNLYAKRIENDMALQAQHYAKQLDAVASRQAQVIDGFLASKDKIIEQTGTLTAGMLDAVKEHVSQLDYTAPQQLAMSDIKSLPTANVPQLGTGNN